MSTEIGTGFRGAEGRVGYLMRQAHQAMRSAIEHEVSSIGITGPQFSLLSAIRHEPGVTGTELAQNSMLRQQTANEIVRTLERQGLVERRADPADRRALRIHLTPTGEGKLAEADGRVAALERLTREGLSAKEWAVVAGWLVDSARTLSNHRPPPRRRHRGA